MKYFFLHPEVGGHIMWSERDGSGQVLRLHYEFDGYIGGAIVTSFGSYIVTKEAKRELEAMRATGISFDKVKTSKSDQFDEMQPGARLPDFVWLKIEGRAGYDDFGIAADRQLVVSQRVLDIFNRLGLANAKVREVR